MEGTTGDRISERSVIVLAEAARRAGVDPDDAALAPTRRHANGAVLVPVEEYRAVLRRIFAEQKDTLGIELARNLPVDASGLWGFLLRSSPTLGDMLFRAARYMRVFYRYTRMSLAGCDEGLRLTCHHPSPSPFGNRPQEVCFFLGQWMTWGRTLVGGDVGAERVSMQWAGPPDPRPVEAFFRCRVAFGSREDSLVLDRSVVDMPLPERSPELAAMFEDYAAALIRELDAECSFAEHVREAVAEGLLRGVRSEREVAEKLGVTRRTLRRRLAAEGLTFREIRRDLLRTRAERMLRENRLPISEISYLLGYSEPSTFHRAFREWTGRSPAAWRAEQ